ncbi:MAG: hypothetical protein PUH24_07335 [Prevotellaceae bacterium]|nr:hypothetical protein [Prevotella sp.]MDD7258059.1 hypothetical protein [Prevotellaceae bacterium]MDY6131170.1 hypothetical protein [Prevotella sp.]
MKKLLVFFSLLLTIPLAFALSQCKQLSAVFGNLFANMEEDAQDFTGMQVDFVIDEKGKVTATDRNGALAYKFTIDPCITIEYANLGIGRLLEKYTDEYNRSGVRSFKKATDKIAVLSVVYYATINGYIYECVKPDNLHLLHLKGIAPFHLQGDTILSP